MTMRIDLGSTACDLGWRMDPAALTVLRAAASVMFQRFHDSPEDGAISAGGTRHMTSFNWDAPDARTVATHQNTDDATRDGAYAVAFAALRQLGPFVFVHRAERKSGADFVLVREGDDGGPYVKLEVSGIGKGDQAAVARRLRQKVDQVKRPDPAQRVVAVVVRFERPEVAVEGVGSGVL